MVIRYFRYGCDNKIHKFPIWNSLYVTLVLYTHSRNSNILITKLYSQIVSYKLQETPLSNHISYLDQENIINVFSGVRNKAAFIENLLGIWTCLFTWMIDICHLVSTEILPPQQNFLGSISSLLEWSSSLYSPFHNTFQNYIYGINRWFLKICLSHYTTRSKRPEIVSVLLHF